MGALTITLFQFSYYPELLTIGHLGQTLEGFYALGLIHA